MHISVFTVAFYHMTGQNTSRAPPRAGFY